MNATKKEFILGIYFAVSLILACVEVTSDSTLVFVGYYVFALANLGNCVRVLNAYDRKKKNKNAVTTNRN